MSLDHIRHSVGILGKISSVFLFASPMPTFKRIIKNKSVEEFHPYPYLAAVMNCMVWIYYGMLFVHPYSILLVIINSVGLFFHLSYLSIFFCYTGKRYRLEIVVILLAEIVGVAAIIAGTMLGLHTYASRSMLKVIKTKSAEFLPKLLCIAGFLNGVCWLIYARYKFDPYILVGNGVGTLLAYVQLVLLHIYQKPSIVDRSHMQGRS
ncbi:bidirectional sugar transporter SWEET5-like isoform X2 [Lycium ferocissimum]|uniref:bidirectional sugar transporter SWEET5-like isoform X2 n=1 Tax=Lycium ferocissimum TaxID=112874 RepID=UPI002815DEFD|nr:bidirectional sugar transporter SWEET5-like isoform X2 [Lycium ferocissimum]